MSPGRRSGVVPSQQAPPGWLTSTSPANGSFGPAFGSACGIWVAELTSTSWPPSRRRTWTATVSVARKPVDEMKSRDGNEMIWTGEAGGSFTGVPAGSAATGRTEVIDWPVDWPERLPTASPASTVYVYVPGGTLRSTKDVGAG